MEGIAEDIFRGCPEIFLEVIKLIPGSPAPLPALSPSLPVLMGRCRDTSGVDKKFGFVSFSGCKTF